MTLGFSGLDQRNQRIHFWSFKMSNIAERLLETARTLPEPLLTEVLDFAEFLRMRQERQAVQAQVMPLTDLCGGLNNSLTFSGSPSSIQESMRNEWH